MTTGIKEIFLKNRDAKPFPQSLAFTRAYREKMVHYPPPQPHTCPGVLYGNNVDLLMFES